MPGGFGHASESKTKMAVLGAVSVRDKCQSDWARSDSDICTPWRHPGSKAEVEGLTRDVGAPPARAPTASDRVSKYVAKRLEYV